VTGPTVYARSVVRRDPPDPPWEGAKPITWVHSARTNLWHRLTLIGTIAGRPETWETECGLRYLSGQASGTPPTMEAPVCPWCSGEWALDDQGRAIIAAREGHAYPGTQREGSWGCHGCGVPIPASNVAWWSVDAQDPERQHVYCSERCAKGGCAKEHPE
jgi:hypothetical protein